MGTYGLVRFAFPLFPAAATFFAPVLAMLAVVGIIYGALVAMVQPDMKKLVAYSSVSHLGFVVLGIAAMNMQGVQGAVYQMLSHGISTGGLFLIVGMLSDRRHTRLIAEYGGLKKVMPHLVAVFLIVTLASIGLPGLNGFVGEFLILLGAFRWNPRMAAFAATGVILSATYMLWMFQRVNYGPVTNEKNERLVDLRPREWLVIVPIIALAILMGVLPNLFLRPIGPAVQRMLSQIEQGSAPAADSGGAMMAGFNAIVPMACVAAAAIAAMVAEAFSVQGERMPIAPLGVIGLVGAAVASAALWNHNTSSFGVVAADNFGLFVTGILIVVGLLSLAFSGPTIDREQLPRGEYYALMLFALAGMMLMATATDLLVIFLALEVLSHRGVRADRHPPRFGRVDGGRVQVLPARRLLERVLPLRHRVHLRGDGQHAPRSHRQRHRCAGERRRRRCRWWPWVCCWSGSRSRSRRCHFTCGRRTPTKARRLR